ncbi:hypothetical protein SIXOD_v1c12890 [Spiroplasma ixodetis Y32]|nr:hypothetical protein SIXOD_v1c12890 [Spiroplasma ixodetis Y32]
MVPWRILNVWWHFKHLILLKLEVFKLVQEHMIHYLFFFKLAIYFKQSCSVWKALLNSFNFIVSSTSTCGEKSVIKLGKALVAFGKSLTDPNKKEIKKQNKINKLQSKLNSINKQTEVKSIY